MNWGVKIRVAQYNFINQAYARSCVSLSSQTPYVIGGYAEDCGVLSAARALYSGARGFTTASTYLAFRVRVCVVW